MIGADSVVLYDGSFLHDRIVMGVREEEGLFRTDHGIADGGSPTNFPVIDAVVGLKPASSFVSQGNQNNGKVKNFGRKFPSGYRRYLTLRYPARRRNEGSPAGCLRRKEFQRSRSYRSTRCPTHDPCTSQDN